MCSKANKYVFINFAEQNIYLFMISFIFTQRRARIKLQLSFLSHFSSFYRIDYDYIFHMEDLKYFLQINCLKMIKN